MNTQKAGAKKSNVPSPRPRREKPMLDRALEYAKLHNGGKGMKAADMSAEFDENEVTIYKLIRLGEAPKGVISLIRKGDIPATVVANLIKASMTPDEVTSVVNEEVKRRNDARHELHKAGFRGASSMTLRRAIRVAVGNLRERRVIRGEGQKAVVRALTTLFSSDSKLAPADIEKVILMN